MAANKREDLLDLIPAYAIGALDEDERAEFESWLHGDPEAQVILADYQAVSDHLVALVPLRPAPDHLQDDLRQRLTASRGGRAAGKPGARRITWILAAAALFTVVILGVLLVVLNHSDSPPDAAQLYAQLEAQPGSSQYGVVPGEVDDAVSGVLVVSADGELAVLCLWYLPQIASDQTFQMWLIDSSGTRTSGGLFQADAVQDALYIQVPFDRPVTAYQGVGVSLEPAGGSPYEDQPTGPRVLSVPLN
jgi:anti-sigma-K factor RskA